jgi:branched-chain amino acid transport system substrate-binding protein
MVDGLRRAGRNPPRESLIAELESMHNIDYDGFLVNYGKTSRLGSRYLESTVISKDGRFLR